MNHLTLFSVSGLPEMTSQNRVTFLLSSSLIGEEGDMRRTTSGVSAIRLIVNFNHSATKLYVHFFVCENRMHFGTP